jgi:hypothetical protein
MTTTLYWGRRHIVFAVGIEDYMPTVTIGNFKCTSRAAVGITVAVGNSHNHVELSSRRLAGT